MECVLLSDTQNSFVQNYSEDHERIQNAEMTFIVLLLFINYRLLSDTAEMSLLWIHLWVRDWVRVCWVTSDVIN